MSSFFSIYFLSSAFRLVYVCVQVQVTSVVQRKGMPASEEVYVVQLPVAAYVYFTARIEKGPLPCLALRWCCTPVFLSVPSLSHVAFWRFVVVTYATFFQHLFFVFFFIYIFTSQDARGGPARCALRRRRHRLSGKYNQGEEEYDWTLSFAATLLLLLSTDIFSLSLFFFISFIPATTTTLRSAARSTKTQHKKE